MAKTTFINTALNHKFISGALLLSLALSILGYFRSETITTIDLELTAKESAARKIKFNIAGGIKIKDDIEGIELLMTKIDARVAKSDHVLNLGYIYKLGTESGTKLTNVNKIDDGKSQKSDRNYLSYSLNAEGSFQNIIKLITLIGGYQYYTRTNLVSINSLKESGSSTEDELMISCLINLDIYTGNSPK